MIDFGLSLEGDGALTATENLILSTFAILSRMNRKLQANCD